MDRIEELKSRIIESSTILFMEHGYRNTSMRMIGQESGISHTQVIYHYTSKSSLASIIIKNYFELLVEMVLSHNISIDKKNHHTNKLLWWSYHYLILTSFDKFSKFYLEFITDESDTFLESAKSVVPKVYTEMFGLVVDLRNKSHLADLYILISVDLMMTRLCINKVLKVRQAIHKLLNLEIIEGFRLSITENEIEDFILENKMLDIISDFDPISLGKCEQS
ncbi:TetR/AcrR family transcriptional regulator [Alkalibacter mobilis]|uniref:TetR/AcrR family transcriptional regulator n=1 Tax=Alkalibacter mobilis TaxID=2787712 RepID=UPI0018A0A344|nr:TetR/AcrR family transcriptional regulator [Alkalibacter mobilis]MBF7096447.1 TetR/AcrR family transcriptional regulator [Alkalibacter mobilis]